MLVFEDVRKIMKENKYKEREQKERKRDKNDWFKERDRRSKNISID